MPGVFPGGYKHPPAHPNCRCVLVAWRREWDEDGPTAAVGTPAPRSVSAPVSPVLRTPTGRSVTDPDEVFVPDSANPAHEMFRNDPRGRAGAERYKQLIEQQHTTDEMISGVVDHAVAMANDDEDAFRTDEYLADLKGDIGEYHTALGKQKGTGLSRKEFKERVVAEFKRRAEEYRKQTPAPREDEDEDDDLPPQRAKAAAATAIVRGGGARPAAPAAKPKALPALPWDAAGKRGDLEGMRRGVVEDLRQHYGLAEQTWRQHQHAINVVPDGALAGASGQLEWDGVCTLEQAHADTLERFGRASAADRARFMEAVRDPGARAAWSKHADANGIAFDAAELHGMTVMVHESVHGHGALTADIYEGVGATVEEMATETMARRYMAERVGVPRGLLYGDVGLGDAPGCSPIGAYVEIIDPVIAGIGSDLKLARGAAIGVLEDAALVFKKLEVGATPTKDAALEMFLDGLPAKTRAKTRDRLQRLARGEKVEVKEAEAPKPKPEKASKAKPAKEKAPSKPKKAPVDKAAERAAKAEAAAKKKAEAAAKRAAAAAEKKRLAAEAKAAKAAAAKEAKARAAAEKKAAAARARAEAAAAKKAAAAEKKAALAAAREAAKAEKARIAAEKKAAAAAAKKAKPTKATPGKAKAARATKADVEKLVKLPAAAPYDYSDEERAEFKQDAMEAIVETRDRWWSTKMGDSVSDTVEDGFTVSQKEFFKIRKEFAQDLAYDELDACLYYSHKGDGVLNSGIRYGMIKDEPDVQEMADRLNSAIRRYKMPEDTYVARGLGGEWAQTLGAKLKPGDTFREPGFSSTSATGFAEEFAGEVRMRIKVPKGAHAAPIPTRYAEEYEYLLPSGTQFRVLSKKKRKNEDGEDMYELELEVVT